MKKIITLLLCVMMVIGMMASCNNGEALSAAEQISLYGKDKNYGKTYDDADKSQFGGGLGGILDLVEEEED